MLNQFLNYLKTEKRYSELTSVAYKNDIEQFEAWFQSKFQSNVDYALLEKGQVRQWIVELSSEHLASTSIKRKISALKALYKFLLKKGILSNNPLTDLILPKPKKKLPIFLVERQTDEMLTMPDKLDFPTLRDYLIVVLFYSTGIRRAELINIKTTDLNSSYTQLKVMGKRSKERILPLLNYASETLKLYAAERAKLGFCHENLILTDGGKKIYEMFVYRVVNKYIRRVSTAAKCSPHVLRHTFATQMLNRGADINAIKELLGHESLAATQVYTHSSVEELKNIFNQAHPRGNSHNN
ncbi:MAG: tyrosine-type recombinase/integrase [Luteibaculaceae bacterium]